MTQATTLSARVCAYFDANPNVSVADVARMFGITVNHAKRILLAKG